MKKMVSTLMSAVLVMSLCSVVLAANNAGQCKATFVKQMILSEEEPAPAPTTGTEPAPAPEPAPEPPPAPEPVPEPK